MTICHDISFPNLFQNLAKNGADIIAVPLPFSSRTGKLHCYTLLRARLAIPNLNAQRKYLTNF